MARHEYLTRLAITLAVTVLVAAACTTATPTPAASQKPAAATPAPAAAKTAPPAPTQAMQVTGKFALEPAHGAWDDKVTATASGLAPATKYDLVWVTAKGAWTLSEDQSKYEGRSFTTVQQTLQSPTTDAAGGLTATFSVPRGFGYEHDVLLVDSAKVIRNKSLFDVDMVTTLTPTSGPAGTPITVEVKGIGYRNYQRSFKLTYDNAYTGWVSSVTTDGYAKFVIPATGRPGTHIVTLGHADFSPPYLNPQQQPVVAGRPFPHLPFTITDGPAVMPAPAAQQAFATMPAQPVDKGIWTSPAGAIVGAPMRILGKGLPANTELELTWTTLVGNRTVTGFEERTKTMAKVRTDASGTLAYDLPMPDDLGGSHVIVAKLGDTAVAKTSAYILANAFPLSVERGPSGTRVSVHVKGAGWTETEQIYHLVYDNAYTGYACAFNSSGDIEIFLTMSGDPGWHFIDLYPGIYQGSETAPTNYKEPQLTAATDHPGQPLPIFRWAFFIQ